jgi:hypothetical protein
LLTSTTLASGFGCCISEVVRKAASAVVKRCEANIRVLLMAKSWRWKSSFNGWRRNSNVGGGVLRNKLPEVMDQEQTLYVCFVAFELKPL